MNEAKIGDVFTINDTDYRVVETNKVDCSECAGTSDKSLCRALLNYIGSCSYRLREDNKNVIYKEVK